MSVVNSKVFGLIRLFSKFKCHVSPNEFSAHTYATNADLEKKRQEMMARNLPKQKPIPGVKNILVVASGKGGVGKSTTAVNLATAMATLEPKLKIGLLDADVFGPSIPLMMNVNEAPLLTEDNLMVPLVNYGVKCMSMGFLMAENSAVMWRGLMVMSALEKLMRKVDWGKIDCLIIDTPPGTGDTHLSLIQNLPISGAVLVTTPQQASLQVVRRGITMFQKLNIPIIGIVQNMCNITCPKCDSPISVFGSGAEKLADEQGIEIIQDIPLDSEITNCGDAGKPVVVARPDSLQAELYIQLAEIVAEFLQNLTPDDDDDDDDDVDNRQK